MCNGDVLIVGAGPVGLTLACELRRHGVACDIIDKLEAPTTQSRATDVHARTLEVFDDMGVAETMIAAGTQLSGMTVFRRGEQIADVRFVGLETAYPYSLGLPQSTTERILAQRLQSLGGTIERGATLESIGERSDSVEVGLTVATAPGLLRRKYRYVVGCDGAHSTTRTLLGVPFEGAAYPEHYVLLDVQIDWDLPHDRMHVFFGEEGFLLYLPLPGMARARLFADMVDDQSHASLELFETLLVERGKVPATLSDPGWMSNFRIHRRLARQYQVGRVFLAGDAAHIHSPVGGLGMNTGIQDAYNLAWKLALVVRGVAAPALLESYELERRPVASTVLFSTHVATTISTWRNPVLRDLRDDVVRSFFGLDFVGQHFSRESSELHVHYRGSPIVAEDRSSVLGATVFPERDTESPSLSDWLDFGQAPAVGTRAPDVDLPDGRRLHELLRGTAHVALFFDGAASTEEGYAAMASAADLLRCSFSDLVRCYAIIPGSRQSRVDGLHVIRDPEHDIHKRYGATAECLYLVRPDGYIGYRCQPLQTDAMLTWLSRVMSGDVIRPMP